MILVVEFFLYTLFLTYFIQSQAIFKKIVVGLDKLIDFKFFEELLECRVCLGFWISLSAYFIFRIGLLDNLESGVIIRIINPILTAAFVSFVQNLIYHGWNTLYRTFVIK